MINRRKTLAGGTALAASVCGFGASAMAQSRRAGMTKQFSFERDRFVEDCIAANAEADKQQAVGEVLKRAVHDHRAVLSALGEPVEAGLDVLHRSSTLTIFAAKWTPQMNLVAHDHRMWALIGIYTGREDNIHWDRRGDAIEATSATVLFEGDVAALPADAIHSVTNPLQRFTGGLHIYGGDFFDTDRSQWNPETLAEEHSDGDVIQAMFAEENARLRR